MAIDEKIMDQKGIGKLNSLNNQHVMEIVEKYIALCKPDRATVITDSKDDVELIRQLSLKNREEAKLNTQGHTIHFDSYFDQGRDKANTKILTPGGKIISRHILTDDRDKCLQEISGLFDGIMRGKEMYILFFCLGPLNSKFSIYCLQITDSAYVGHCESILYRNAYSSFKKLGKDAKFFHFVHSAGELENNVSKNIDKRRIYIDLEGNRVLTINNQYAGNSVGLKKLALRLAIKKGHEENWLCEHMLIMGIHPEGKNRVSYFTGAFPSACGKTSTAMIPGQTVVGDDIAYIRAGGNGKAYAANVEQGIFGIIEDVNPVDDPLIYKALTTPRELIFSNVLVKDGLPYWLGMGKEIPDEGINYAGNWKLGDKDAKGKEILPAHKNARYTIRLQELENADPKVQDPNGVPLSGIIYGGRDSDTNPPIVESFSWAHGVFMGAALESETTAATIGQMGVRCHDPMANLDFLAIPLGMYIKNHLKFGEQLDNAPKIFATNYFLKHEGKYLNKKVDKKIWIMWMEARAHNEYDAIETPIGFIPKYDDLRGLFKKIFGRDYSKDEYIQQFSIRITKLLERLDRIEKIYREEEHVPEIFHEHIQQQRKRLVDAREKYGMDAVSPFDLVAKKPFNAPLFCLL